MCSKVEDFLLGSDWLEHHGAQWDFARGTVTLGDKCIKVHRRHQTGICRRIVVASDCIVPAKHEANVPMRMEDDGIPLPPCDWAIEPQGLGPGLMTARTLFSDAQTQLVAHVLNNSSRDKSLSINSFLSMAELVQCLSGTDSEPASLMFGSSSDCCDSKSSDESTLPASSSLLSDLMLTDETELRASSVSSQTVDATVSDSSTYSEDRLEHIDSLLRSLPADLTSEQRQRAETFIRSHANVFSRSEYDIGRTNIIPHRTDTGEHCPHFEQLRRHPTTQLLVIDEHVQHMLDHDVIEPAASPWCSNVVMVRKQDGTMWLCVDYRKLNSLTVKDKFPLPKIDTCLDTLNGSEFFSTCDLHWGYWQTEIDERDHDKTAFVTQKGQWRFKVLSFGLANTPSQFARIMELVMSGLTYDVCLVYLDDILIFSKTDEHLDHLATVFDRLDCYALKLKPSKCSLFQCKVSFLGHVVSGHGIECDLDKIASIATWPTPSNIAEVRTFCGLASYYRTFVCNFAAIARPLHNLTKKGATFEWTNECETAFQELKRALSSTPILVALCDDGQYVLDTDASDTALGAVLQQEQNGKLHVIGYASRTLTPAEARYCITRRELLGVVFGLKKYRQHLLG